MSKKCKLEEGTYYSVNDGVYVSGSELNIASTGSKRVVLDLHGVTDLFTTNEFIGLMSKKPDDCNVTILSYVGTTTSTRIAAHHQILELAEGTGVKGYLCFARSDEPKPGNKGGFVGAMCNVSDITFADDSEDHVEAVSKTGANAVHIDPGIHLQRRKQMIVDLLM
jgi:hypothetical protein